MVRAISECGGIPVAAARRARRCGCVMEGAGRDAHRALQKKKETGVKSLDGRVACKLGPDNYGRCEWWLLLQPVESE